MTNTFFFFFFLWGGGGGGGVKSNGWSLRQATHPIPGILL